MKGEILSPDIGSAILRTVAYVDIFDYPPTEKEIHRYLIEFPATQGDVREALQNGLLVPDRLVHRDGFYALPGREEIIEIRQARTRVADRLWPRAVRYGQLIGSLPFVSMVAVTGGLAVSNAVSGDDIDYLIITKPGRVWLSRLFVIVLVRLARLQSIILCPNYVLAENALHFPEQSLYTAHEVMHMTPILGDDVYRKLIRSNPWVAHYLPNAVGPPRKVTPRPPIFRALRPLAEMLLQTRVGDRLEAWEMNRQLARLSHQPSAPDEVVYSPERCKGHFRAHGNQVMRAFNGRILRMELD